MCNYTPEIIHTFISDINYVDEKSLLLTHIKFNPGVDNQLHPL